MPSVIPKPMSGFPELLPEEQLVLNRCLRVVRETFELFGFAPIETPSVERKEVLTSKGGDEKEIYALSRLFAGDGESNETEFALHFDLTVPLARYVAMYAGKLNFPFRRYQIQKVWRGERPQKGRYREFYQCDIDVIGRGSLAAINDAEIPSIIYKVFTDLKIGPFIVRVNNRRLLQGYFESQGVAVEHIGDVLRSVDRLDKIGQEKVLLDLTTNLGLDARQAGAILQFVTSNFKTDELLGWLSDLPAMDNPRFAQGLKELSDLVAGVRSLGVPDANFKVDLSIARGLGYYTGTVYETQLLEHPDLGSVCSGGRYEDLAGFFTNEKLPGVGISIGLSRLVLALLDRGVLKAGAQTPTRVLVTTLDPNYLQAYLGVAADLRAAGVPTEVYLDRKGVGDQLKYASRKGIPYAVIAGETELQAGHVKVKNLGTGEESVHARDAVAAYLAEHVISA